MRDFLVRLSPILSDLWVTNHYGDQETEPGGSNSKTSKASFVAWYPHVKKDIHTYIPLLTKATGMAETVLVFRHGLRTPDKAFFNNIPNFWANAMGQIG